MTNSELYFVNMSNKALSDKMNDDLELAFAYREGIEACKRAEIRREIRRKKHKKCIINSCFIILCDMIGFYIIGLLCVILALMF